MQGRLVPPERGRFQSFPREGWRREFGLAAEAGLGAIEWIYDAFGEDMNPIASDQGVAEILELSAEHGVAVVSLCADYFMDRPIVGATDADRRDVLARLYWLIERARRLRIRRIVLPFVDGSRIKTDDDIACVVRTLVDVMPVAQLAGIEIHLETALEPAAFAALLRSIAHPMIRVNYDIGNSAALGYDPDAEFAAYGPDIGSVHIKDRELGGGTCALGTGAADLPAVFRGLQRLGYSGDYVLQAARGEPGAEVALAASNRQFAQAGIERAGRSVRVATE